ISSSHSLPARLLVFTGARPPPWPAGGVRPRGGEPTPPRRAPVSSTFALSAGTSLTRRSALGTGAGLNRGLAHHWPPSPVRPTRYDRAPPSRCPTATSFQLTPATH